MNGTPSWLEDARAQVLRVHLRRGGGSAFVWDTGAKGSRVLTNHHVVAGQGTVTLSRFSGEELPARVVASAPDLDLALLETEARLPAAPIGDSRALRLGELVFALGHPWGRPWSLTRGVVSGLGLVGFGGRQAEYVRSDVRLAPGNSGGPLLGARGEVVGVNSMVWGSTLGVAIPAHVAQEWISTLAVPAVRLGVEVVGVALAGQPTVMITGVEEGGAARYAGLRVGDVIVAANGQAVGRPEALRAALAGGHLTLDVWRGGAGLRLDVPLVASSRVA